MALLSKKPAWGRIIGDILSTETETVLQLTLSDVRSVTAILTVFNTTQDKSKQIQTQIVNSDGDVNDSVGPKTGDGIQVALNAIKDGSNLKLNVTNNEAYDLKYSLIFSDS